MYLKIILLSNYLNRMNSTSNQLAIDLALLLFREGKYRVAKEFLESEANSSDIRNLDDLLQLYRQKYNDNDLELAGTLLGLSIFFREYWLYLEEKAKPYGLEALEIYKRLFNRDHPDIATSLNNLALIYQKQHKYTKT